MDSFREMILLRLARQLAVSHGTFYAAALLADMGISLPLALAALASRDSELNWTRLTYKELSRSICISK